jgi:hypothetical protein
MSDQALRSKIIRLAHTNPELRSHLMPLLTKTAAPDADSLYGAKKNLTRDLGNAILNQLDAGFRGVLRFDALNLIPNSLKLEIVGYFSDDPKGNDYIWVDVDTTENYTVEYTFGRGGKNVAVKVPLKYFNNYWSHVSVPKLGADIAKLVGDRLRDYLAGS